MKKLLSLSLLFACAVSFSQTPCVNGFAGNYPCNGYDLQSQISLSTMNSTGANDSWGWTDPLDGKEYALVGLEGGTAFIDLSNPTNPIYLGKLPTHTNSSNWRDVKVYQNHAFVVSEAFGHGMQVFDLTRLRDVTNPPVTFTEDAHYDGFGNAHNIIINEDTGYAYGVGTDTYNGGSHFVNIQDPLNPVAAGGFGDDFYTHDAQVITYNGPDADYQGHEILLSSSGGEQYVSIVDVTNKANPVTISTISYSNVGYTHQGWFTEDQRYFLLGDEFDENDVGFNTRTVIFDLNDLDNPQESFQFFGTTSAIDHNGYVKGNEYYLANYSAGMRVMDITNIGTQTMSEKAYFDTYPSDNNASYNGTWNVYPYFGSGNVMITDRSGGFFLVKASEPDTENPNAVCQNTTVSLDEAGQVLIEAASIDGGSSDNSGFFTTILSQNTFTCEDMGENIITFTITDPAGNTDSCTATITIIDDLSPEITCPANATVPYETGDDFYVLPDYVAENQVVAIDNCTPSLQITQDPPASTQLQVGTYTISFTTVDDENNSSQCSFDLTVVEILGVTDTSLENSIKIFPNPVANVLRINSNSAAINSVKVVDKLGKVLFERKAVTENNLEIPFDQVQAGTYFVVINNSLTKQIIKK